MERLVAGDVVVVPFPFSDLSQAKRRPALVVAVFGEEELLLAQITSQAARDQYAITMTEADFQEGSLRKSSHVRPNKLFTCDRQLILYKVGTVTATKMREITDTIVAVVTQARE